MMKHNMRNKVKSIYEGKIRYQIGNGYDDNDDDDEDNNNVPLQEECPILIHIS